jgi:hypothetical protein
MRLRFVVDCSYIREIHVSYSSAIVKLMLFSYSSICKTTLALLHCVPIKV